MRDGKPRIAAIVEKPIQFYAPHYRQIVCDGRLDLEVLFLSDRGITPFDYHGTTVTQEASVLEGYQWRMLRNRSIMKNSGGVLSNIVPELAATLKNGNYDAVWVHGYNLISHWAAFYECIRSRIPILLRGESENFFKRSTAKRLLKRATLRPLFKRISAFLYIGTCNRQFYEDFGVPEQRLFSVPYGVDNDWIHGSPKERCHWRKSIRRELGLSEDTLVYIFTSKHRHPKRPSDAVEAFCRLYPDANMALIMLGDGNLRLEAEAVYHSRGCGHRVFFLGLQPYSQLRCYLAAADVLVFPSVENWGMAINEAIASGLAVISSDQVAGWYDMVKPGFNGTVYRAGSIDALAAHMNGLLEHRELVAQMKKNSLEVASRMGFQQMTDGLVAAVNFAVAERHGLEIRPI